ncbi:MAG: dTDP-4-dehydrorhamnose 3,5-epimerase [Bacteroidota bacterium]|nr:dTDP-4-dehydrorhamnose 3,5-epimerase [Bacteroidota bacterium]
MKVFKTEIEGLLIIEPKIFRDERGYFYESYNKNIFNGSDINLEFVQDNQSLSKYGVLRGLHFQNPPFAQAKIVRVIKGAVMDVAVDIRKNSSTYGKHCKIELSEDNFRMFYLPVGFAHGFISLADNTIFSYKCSNVYNKESEGTIKWNDPILNIDWGIQNPVISEKDITNAQSFSDFQSKFL